MERSRGSAISYLMDRCTVNLAKSQQGFIDVIINPAYQAAAQVIDLDQNLRNIEHNKVLWQERVEEYEEKMNKEKDSLHRRQSIKLAM